MDAMAVFWVTLKVAGFGGLLALDRTAALQLMLSRPLLAALWAGWLAGNWELGLWVGATLELYFLAEVPVGTNIPTDDTLLALAAGGAAAALKGPLPPTPADGSLVLMVLLSVLPWAALTRKLDALVRERNVELIDEVETRLLAGSRVPAVNFHLWGLLHFYGAALAAVAVLMLSALLLAPPLLWLLPDGLRPLSDRMPLLLPLAGGVALLFKMNRKRQLLVFFGAAAGLLLL